MLTTHYSSTQRPYQEKIHTKLVDKLFVGGSPESVCILLLSHSNITDRGTNEDVIQITYTYNNNIFPGGRAEPAAAQRDGGGAALGAAAGGAAARAGPRAQPHRRAGNYLV